MFRSAFCALCIALLALASLLPAYAGVTGMSLSATPSSPVRVGTPLTLRASATPLGVVAYKFRVGQKSGTSYRWVTLQEYHPAATCAWTPTVPGAYTLAVYARTYGSTVPYEAYKTLAVTVNPIPPTTVSLTVEPTWVGRTTTVRARTTGGDQVHYRFRVARRINGTLIWTTLQEMSAAATCAWTPSVAATYVVAVYAREASSRTSYDCYQVINLPVAAGPPRPTLTGFSPAVGSVGAIVTVTGAYLTGATAVTFNGIPAVFSVVSDKKLAALVPAGATRGTLAVTTGGGTATSAARFTVSGLTPPNAHTMVWVPGGAFTMGTDYGAWWDGPTTQQVTLAGFAIDKHEVTVAQYQAFCTATGRAMPAFPTSWYWNKYRAWDELAMLDHPIVSVTWDDAAAYAAWAGLQLPTEAQWEYAARGPGERNFPWGGTASGDDIVNGYRSFTCANFSVTNMMNTPTWPVGSFPEGASWCGALDLAGNAWEWCADWYGPYAATPVTDPTGPSSGEHRVLRGGSWNSIGGQSIRSANRAYASQALDWDMDATVGFRCVSPAYLPPQPTITGFTPSSGRPGTTVTIAGTDFRHTTAVTFNGTAADFTVVSPTELTAYVPTGATGGPLTVTGPGGITTSIGRFTPLPPLSLPTVTDIQPPRGMAGDTITLTGTNFTDATAVTFNEVPALFTVMSPTRILANVPAGVRTGPITVTAPDGTATSASDFRVPPVIYGFMPITGVTGTIVTVYGTNFIGTTAVTFNGAPAQFTTYGSTVILATAPAHLTTGPIAVTTPDGTATSAASFMVVPTLDGFAPTGGYIGTTITLSGAYLADTTAVSLAGQPLAFTVVDINTVTVVVPPGAVSGLLTVTTPGGVATSARQFTLFPQTHTMVWVPGGEFAMGSPTVLEYGYESPGHHVTLTGFWIDAHEVTVAQYRAFCAATERELPPFPRVYSWPGESGWEAPALQNYPMVAVSYADATAYAAWAGLRLPTEAQWEYAARGTDGRYYPWGGAETADWYTGWDLHKCANYDNSWVVGISAWPVGSFPTDVSWCGALDLAGNVREWCADWYGPYAATPVSDPTGAASGEFHVVRGGACSTGSFECLNTYRSPFANDRCDDGNLTLGFRCVLAAPGP
jgi:formylglycine-generating enzyme required for sulfatase activity